MPYRKKPVPPGGTLNRLEFSEMENRIRDAHTPQSDPKQLFYWRRDTMEKVFAGQRYREYNMKGDRTYVFPYKKGLVVLHRANSTATAHNVWGSEGSNIVFCEAENKEDLKKLLKNAKKIT